MFCYQCEQTAQGTGCSAFGVCGKSPEVASLQDLLVYLCKGISQYAHRAETLGKRDQEIDLYVTKGLFTTVTNVNFDPARLEKMIYQGEVILDKARTLYQEACEEKNIPAETLEGPCNFDPAESAED